MEEKSSVWGDRFITAAIVQGGIIAGLALMMVVMQMTFTNVNIIQHLSVTFDGPAKWFFLGIIFYLILVVAIAVTAVFYNHLEINLKRKVSGVTKALASIHIIGMNVGGAAATILMIVVGLAGSGIFSLLTEGQLGRQNIAIVEEFITPIAAFIGVLTLGVICGGVAYILAYRSKHE